MQHYLYLYLFNIPLIHIPLHFFITYMYTVFYNYVVYRVFLYIGYIYFYSLLLFLLSVCCLCPTFEWYFTVPYYFWCFLDRQGHYELYKKILI